MSEILFKNESLFNSDHGGLHEQISATPECGSMCPGKLPLGKIAPFATHISFWLGSVWVGAGRL